MEIKELEILLKNTKYEQYIDSINFIELKGYKYNNLFKIGNTHPGQFVIKIREKNNKSVTDSIKNMIKMNDDDNFIHKNKDIIEKDGFIILVSDWLNGFQPIDNNREYLPAFFSKLAHFNKNNIRNGPFTSMYADEKYFETIEELINWEIYFHKKYLPDIIKTNEINEALECLKNGIPCLILEDMNTGNLMITENGEYKFIDTEWIINGLNLYQFEKIDYFGFDKRKWYNINEEVKECYLAYFETLGIKTEDANDQIRAFELLQVLRTNTCLICNEDENNNEIKKRIKTVLEHKNYI